MRTPKINKRRLARAIFAKYKDKELQKLVKQIIESPSPGLPIRNILFVTPKINKTNKRN